MSSSVRRTAAATTVAALAASLVLAPSALAGTPIPGIGARPVTGAAPAPTVRVVTDGDTYVAGTTSTTPNGAGPDLRAGSGSGSTKVTYLHFTVPAADIGRVTAASLVLTRTAHHLPTTTIDASSVAGAWDESTLTAADAPTPGAVLSSTAVSAADTTVTLGVTPAVNAGQSTVSLAVTSPITTDVAMFNSRESGAPAPTLVLTVATSTPPTPPAPPGPPSTSCAVTADLVSPCRVWLGDAPQAYGTTRIPSQAGRLAVDEGFTGREFDILHQYKTNGQLFPDAATIALADQGRRLLINWKPATDMTWAAVAAGRADARIDAEAAYLKSHFDRPFLLAIYHEPEDNVNTAAGSGMTPADYVAMYRHTVLRLRADGATMFRTVMNYMGYYRWDWMRDALYPGDDVVDWISWDPYMHTPSGVAGGDFATLVNTAHGTSPGFYDWATTRHPGKPLMLSEWGVYDDNLRSNPMGPAQFYASVARELPQFPALRALVYFTMNPVDVVPGQATSPTVTAAGLAAWRTMAHTSILDGTPVAQGTTRTYVGALSRLHAAGH